MRVLILGLLLAVAGCGTTDPLPSWNEGPVKTSILEYLTAVTEPGGTDFIPVAERVAVLDNDGTFWCERPHYPSTMFQRGLLTTFLRQGRADSTRPPYPAWLSNDRDALRAFGWTRAYEEMNKAFAGMPVQAFRDSARAFMDRTPHEDFGARFTELYYRPMLELARLLEAHDFQVWVVTGAEQDFVRSYIFEASGIPPERVIGSWTPAVSNVSEEGQITVVRGNTQINNGYEAKPGNIETRIGRRPVFAAGNSNNDYPMCLYAVSGDQRGLAIWIHHDDAEREYAYDRGTDRIARLTADHGAAHEVSIQKDWRTIFKAGIARGN